MKKLFTALLGLMKLLAACQSSQGNSKSSVLEAFANTFSNEPLSKKRKEFFWNLDHDQSCDDIIRSVVQFRDNLKANSKTLEFYTEQTKLGVRVKLTGPSHYTDLLHGCDDLHPVAAGTSWDDALWRSQITEAPEICLNDRQHTYGANGDYLVIGRFFGPEDENEDVDIIDEYTTWITINQIKRPRTSRPIVVNAVRERKTEPAILSNLALKVELKSSDYHYLCAELYHSDRRVSSGFAKKITRPNMEPISIFHILDADAVKEHTTKNTVLEVKAYNKVGTQAYTRKINIKASEDNE